MKKLFKIIALCLVLFSINSCCTKEYCDPIVNFPSVYLIFTGYDSEDLENVNYFRLNADNHSVIDSFNNREYNEETLILIGDYESYFRNENIFDLKNYALVIRTISRIDTISGINFTTSSFRQKCHTCFLANGKETFTKIQNFNFWHKGIQYFDGDTLIISK